LVPAALVAPLAAGLADRRAPSRVLAAGYLVQVLGMLATAAATAGQGRVAAEPRVSLGEMRGRVMVLDVEGS
jgi:hypothetical protein